MASMMFFHGAQFVIGSHRIFKIQKNEISTLFIAFSNISGLIPEPLNSNVERVELRCI